MVFLQPIIGGGLEKTPNLAPAKVEIITSPFAAPHMVAGIFIQGLSVKFAETISVNRKMDRNKI